MFCCRFSAGFSPPPAPHLSSYHPLLACTSAPSGHYAGFTTPSSCSLRLPVSSSQTQPPSGPGCLTTLACVGPGSRAVAARCLFVTEPFGQAWWSRLTVGIFDTCILIWTRADLFLVVITHQSYNHCYIPQLLSDLSIGKKIPSA